MGDSKKFEAVRQLGLEERHVEGPLHVLDLPPLYQRPSLETFMAILEILDVPPSTFGSMMETTADPLILPEGVTGYLTSMLSSSLSWLKSDEDRETIIDLASHRLGQRSGRTGMGSLTRQFEIPVFEALDGQTSVVIRLHEPALTEDNLGLKTWSSSYVLAKKLHTIKDIALTNVIPILELGAGTGLVGLAAAAVWQRSVILTDLPSIAPNLARNVAANEDNLSMCGGTACAGVLDWTNPASLGLVGDKQSTRCIAPRGPWKAMTVLAADPIYSPDHPRMLVQAVTTWLSRIASARLVLAYPIRAPYLPQIEDLKHRLGSAGLVMLEESHETTRDDWKDDVEVVWNVWTWKC